MEKPKNSKAKIKATDRYNKKSRLAHGVCNNEKMR